jgi:hypothetical protein
MKTKLAWGSVFVALTAFAIAANAFYDAPSPTKLEGVINDFSPQSTTPTGPYLVNGLWTLQFQPSGKARFFASLNMVRSDLWFVNTPGSDPNSQADRNFHTHHVQVTSGSTQLVGTTLVIEGAATVTSNGNEVFPGSSVHIEITGGNTVAPSSISLTFVGPVTAHFTDQPYEGVVAMP